MAYKNASDMKQASLRRVTPKRLGDFPVNDLTPEQRRESLIAALIRENLPENEIDELIKSGTCDDYNKILEAWNKHKSSKQD